MKKKWMTAIVSLGIFCMSFTSVLAAPMQLVYDGKTHLYDLPPITLYIDGEKADTSLMPPIQLNQRTLVPVREIFEPMGAFVEWKAEEKKVYIDYNNTLLILEMNNKEVWKNGEIIELDVPAKVINNKIMVPVRFISEEMGFGVQWIAETREIFIKGKEDPIPPVVKPEMPDEEIPEIEDNKDEKADLSELLMNLDGISNIYEGIKNKHKVYAPQKSYDKTSINTVAMAQSGDFATAIIQASGPISGIESAVSEGKIVIDILNSQNGLSSSITPDSNSYVKTIRTSQYEKDKTRVVFDLKAGASTRVSLTSDRKGIVVEMDKQPLEGMVIGEDNISGYIALDNIAPSQLKLIEDIGQLTIQLENIKVDEAIRWRKLEGQYLDEVSVENTSKGIEIVAKLNSDKVYFVQSQMNKGDTIIRIMQPEFKNINYSAGNKTITLDAPSGLNINNINVEDNYREKNLVINLGANYEEQFGKGVLKVGDENVNNIEIKHDGTTKIIINENSIHAVNLKNEGSKIQIQLVKPKEKYNRILVLDPGHGGNDGGTSGNSLKEKNVNLKQAFAVRDLIERNTDIKVYITREQDATLTLAFRTDLANDIQADMFVSVHNNSASSAVKGTEVLYCPNASDLRSQKIAQLIQDKIIAATGMNNRGIKQRPDLYVLRTSKMPAVLIEGGFLSNAEDAAKLNSEEFTQKFAYAVYEGIIEDFNTLNFR